MMIDYGYKVVLFEPNVLEENGFEKVAHLPFIFDGRPAYARIPNRFLIDLGTGKWDITFRGTREVHPPSRISMRNSAYWLANALEWADTRGGMDLMQADYLGDLMRYQKEMLEGIWSDKNNPLSPNTVNPRINIAIAYQLWGADKLLRPQFLIPTKRTTYVAGSYKSSRSHEAKTVESRRGKVKQKEKMLITPERSEIQAWFERLKQRPVVGETEGLIAELILNTAIRREEAACWRLDTLPLEKADWQIVNPNQAKDYQSVQITLKWGTKGTEYLIDEHGDKLGPEGTIKLPLWLAEKLHYYRENVRPYALMKRLKRGGSVAEQKRIKAQAVHLFLNPVTGERYTGRQIYNFWASVNPPENWSPHKARDWWATTYLETRMKQHAALIEEVLKLPNLAQDHPVVLALKDTAVAVIQMEITPQLRHRSSQTTEVYLKWYFASHHLSLEMTPHWVALDENANGEAE